MGGSVMEMALTDNKKEFIKPLVNYSTLGLEMGLSVAIGIGMGYFLDRYFTTYPYLTIIFMFFGIAAAFKTIIVLIKKVQREDERDKTSRN
jgi:ATP synthase protein I